MLELVTTLNASLFSIIFFVFLPGVCVSLILRNKGAIEFSEAFFLGWVFLVIVCSFVIPFTSSTHALSNIIALINGCFLFCCLIYWIKQAELASIVQALLNSIKAISLIHIGVFFVTLFLFISFVGTHNLGFDDTSNLNYLLGSAKGTPYHTFIQLNRFYQIELANYPFFGTILGVVSNNFGSNVVFVYYLTGLCILVSFVLLCLNRLWSSKSAIRNISGILMVLMVLIFFSWDNYFNFCVYPLQEAKLLFITGLIYIFGQLSGKIRDKTDLFFGVSLCSAGTLHHLNLLVCYIPLIAVLSIYIVLKYNLKELRILLIPILLFCFGALPDKGFVNVYSDETIVKEDQEAIVVQPQKQQNLAKNTVQDIAIDKGSPTSSLKDDLRVFVKYFHKLRLRIMRVLTPDLLLIPAIILAAPYLFKIATANYLIFIISFGGLLFSYFSTVPRQALISFYYSSPFLMVYDIYKSKNVFNSRNRYYSDPFTALFLKLTLNIDSKSLDPVSEVLFFSPLFKNGAEKFAVAKMHDVSYSDKVVHNVRYWGLPSLQRSEEDSVMLRTSGNARLELRGNRKDMLQIRRFFYEIFPFLSEKIRGGLIVKSLPDSNLDVDYTDISAYINDELNSSRIYNDSVIIKISDLPANQGQDFSITFHGDWLRYYPLPSTTDISEPELMKGNHPSRKWDSKLLGRSTYRVSDENPIEEAFLLFRVSGHGFIGGLGLIKGVALD